MDDTTTQALAAIAAGGLGLYLLSRAHVFSATAGMAVAFRAAGKLPDDVEAKIRRKAAQEGLKAIDDPETKRAVIATVILVAKLRALATGIGSGGMFFVAGLLARGHF